MAFDLDVALYVSFESFSHIIHHINNSGRAALQRADREQSLKRAAGGFVALGDRRPPISTRTSSGTGGFPSAAIAVKLDG